MWKDTLLQVLIAFLPVFMFMVWYSRFERGRHSHIFLCIVCGLSMILSIQFSTITERGIFLDFGHIPIIIGSLYGGIPAASILLVLYGSLKIVQISHQWEYMLFTLYLFVFVPLLFSRISVFGQSVRLGAKLKIVAVLCSVLTAFLVFTNLIYSFEMSFAEFLRDTLCLLIDGALFLIVTLLSVHLIEMAYERIELQYQLRDVSKKYRHEMRRLQQFIDNTPLMVIFSDNKGRITHINEMALKFLQPLGRQNVLNMDFSLLMQKMDLQFETNPIQRVIQGEERLTEILKIHGRTYYTIICPIKDISAEVTEGVLFIGHDISELQSLKDEVGKMERLSLVGQMAASITHEIRNPMAVIRGFVQLLNERSPQDQQSYFRIVLDELDRTNAIINDFLSLAQNRIVPKEPSDLHEIINKLIPLMWADANMRGQSIDLRLCNHMDLLEMNRKEIKQLILNLARNGMEAMNDKGVLRIETINFEDTVQLRVIDNGIGIPQDKLVNLFEPFYTTKMNGTGLGLPLCLSIVERHNGKIQVESTVGTGTTFIVSFCKPGRNCW
ncbi:ATP-binding protein [Cohnella sp.]|uniref:ATP-binding protein n=1 Tax=Cohnella sp. TaxID=1883426 RepID=UPI003566382B